MEKLYKMELSLSGGKLLFDGEEKTIIICCSELIRNYIRYYKCSLMEIEEVTVEEFKKWMRSVKKYIKDGRLRKTNRVNEYLCGMDISKRLIENIIEIRDEEVTKEMTKYIVGNNVCKEFARKGYLYGLINAHEKGCEMNEETCTEAAKAGSLECLRYAHENGCMWEYETCAGAAKAGSLECLKYAYENGCMWNYMTCENAAKAGSLECLKYAHENGCAWNYTTCENAAQVGSLQCLKYAYENGCKCDLYACRKKTSSREIKEYIDEVRRNI